MGSRGRCGGAVARLPYPRGPSGVWTMPRPFRRLACPPPQPIRPSTLPLRETSNTKSCDSAHYDGSAWSRILAIPVPFRLSASRHLWPSRNPYSQNGFRHPGGIDRVGCQNTIHLTARGIGPLGIAHPSSKRAGCPRVPTRPIEIAPLEPDPVQTGVGSAVQALLPFPEFRKESFHD
jgi:hypothetical protein